LPFCVKNPQQVFACFYESYIQKAAYESSVLADVLQPMREGLFILTNKREENRVKMIL
jgi:hypothetical protein